MAEGDQPERGLFSSLARIFDTVLATVQNRLELFSIELQEEKWRFVEVLVWTAAAVFLAILAVTVFTLFVVCLCGWLFGEIAQLCCLGGFTLLYGAAAYGAVRALRHRLTGGPMPFADTIAELKKDRECFRPKK